MGHPIRPRERARWPLARRPATPPTTCSLQPSNTYSATRCVPRVGALADGRALRRPRGHLSRASGKTISLGSGGRQGRWIPLPGLLYVLGRQSQHGPELGSSEHFAIHSVAIRSIGYEFSYWFKSAPPAWARSGRRSLGDPAVADPPGLCPRCPARYGLRRVPGDGQRQCRRPCRERGRDRRQGLAPPTVRAHNELPTTPLDCRDWILMWEANHDAGRMGLGPRDPRRDGDR